MTDFILSTSFIFIAVAASILGTVDYANWRDEQKMKKKRDKK